MNMWMWRCYENLSLGELSILVLLGIAQYLKPPWTKQNQWITLCWWCFQIKVRLQIGRLSNDLSLPKTRLGGAVYTVTHTPGWVSHSCFCLWGVKRLDLIICNNYWFSWSNLQTEWERRSQASFLAQWRYKQTNAGAKKYYDLHVGIVLWFVVQENPSSLVADPVSILCQKRWSSSASPRPPPPLVASSSMGWTLLTCTQGGRYERKVEKVMPFLTFRPLFHPLHFGLSIPLFWP